MPQIQSIKLSELSSQIRQVIQSSFNNFYWVIAEITDYKFYSQKNHHYFDLVEKSQTGTEIIAKMQAVAWSNGNNSIRNFERLTGQKFKNDIQVLVKVSVEFHASYGLKLVVHDINVNYTIGALEQQKQETLLRLLSECSDFISKIGDKFITPIVDYNFLQSFKKLLLSLLVNRQVSMILPIRLSQIPLVINFQLPIILPLFRVKPKPNYSSIN